MELENRLKYYHYISGISGLVGIPGSMLLLTLDSTYNYTLIAFSILFIILFMNWIGFYIDTKKLEVRTKLWKTLIEEKDEHESQRTY
jgi:hypothetical protein